MYAAIRFFGCILLFLFFFLLYKRKNSPKRSFFVIAFVVLLGVYALSLRIPVENAFLSFSSAETCFNYTNKELPTLTIQGQDSALVLGTDSNQHVCRIIEKSKSGWKIDPKGGSWNIPDDVPTGLIVLVYQHRKTSDTYLFVAAADHSELVLSDSDNTNFIAITQKNNLSNENLYSYCAYIGKPLGQYALSIDGAWLSILL